MIVKVNCDGNHGKITFEEGDEIEVDSLVGNEMIGGGIATVVQHDKPKKRDPKCKQVAPAKK